VGAAALEASYVVIAAGVTVLEVEVLLDLRREGYRLRTESRTRGIASLLGRGEQATEAEGGFRGTEPLPARYRTEGVWRGALRHIGLDYPPGAAGPVLRVLEPREAPGEREPVAPELRRGTLDPLSALVKLSRAVAETGRCDGTAAVFDGRRRSDVAVRTAGRDLLPPRRWGGEAWSGEALRCGLEWRQVAGFHTRQDQEERGRVNTGLAWIAPAWAGGPPVPVQAELPVRWLGTLHLYLVRAAPAREREPDGRQAAPHR
jgi:hypothetical protein